MTQYHFPSLFTQVEGTHYPKRQPKHSGLPLAILMLMTYVMKSQKVRCLWKWDVDDTTWFMPPVYLWPSFWLWYIQWGLRRIPLDGYLRGRIYYDRALLSIAIHFNSLPCSKCLIWGIMAYTKNAQLKNNSICVSYSSYFFSGFLFSLTEDICMKIRSYS